MWAKASIFRMGPFRPPALNGAAQSTGTPGRSPLLHPWIVRSVRVHGGATVIAGCRAQFVVPWLVAVDPAQPVRSAELGQPRRGIGGPDVDRVARHVSRPVGGGHPSGGFRFRAVLRDRLAEQSLLVLPGTPAAIDGEVDPVACGISCRPAQGAEEGWIEVGDARNLVVEDRRAVGDGTVRLAKRTT